MNDILLKLDKRTAEGKKVAKLRKDGLIPSIVYGGNNEPLLMQSVSMTTNKVIQSAGKHTPIYLVIDGKKKLAIIKEIDRNPINNKLRHIAFHTINQNDSIHTQVVIKLTDIGTSEAERNGLVILQAIEDIEIKAKPADLPEFLEVSIKDLKTSEDKLLMSDIKLPKGVSFADAEQDLNLVIANVYEPIALQEANDASAGEADENTEVEAEHGEDSTASEPAEEETK